MTTTLSTRCYWRQPKIVVFDLERNNHGSSIYMILVLLNQHVGNRYRDTPYSKFCRADHDSLTVHTRVYRPVRMRIVDLIYVYVIQQQC